MEEKSITIKLNNGWMDGRVPCFGNGQSSHTSSLATAAVVVLGATSARMGIVRDDFHVPPAH